MSDRQICSKEHPYHEGDGGQWQHPEAESIKDEGDYEQFKCPICGKTFWVTVAQ